ncbi:MAG: zf-HC2 domain-containing protein [Cytophagales bacterium]|nr:zf-HC2 domain-containing protein [Armatimonadota bacterium]
METMLDCKKIQPRLSEYVDGALDGETTWSLKRHLSSCAVCSQVESDLRGTSSLLRSLPEAGPSLDFEARLAKRLADQVLEPRRAPLLDRLRDWWYDAPYARPAVTSGLAVAALLPIAFVAFGGSRAGRTDLPQPSPPGFTIANAVSGDPTLEQVWAEHASSDPLGDSSSLLLPSGPTSVDGGVSADSALSL